MNKTKKIALAAVSLAMAGTMAFGMVGCTNDPNNPTGGRGNGESFVKMLNENYNLSKRVEANNTAWQTAKGYWDYLKTQDTTPSATAGANTTTAAVSLGIAIGHNSADTGAFYGSLTGNVSLPGGLSVKTGDLKPAFKAIQDRLQAGGTNVTFANQYNAKSTSANLQDLKDTNKWGESVFVATSDLSKAVASAHNDNDILNLGDYLDRMPNFKAFLEANPIVYLSLLQEGMSTTDGSGKEIFVAPYFDGNDDIERYCLMRQDWVDALLDGTLAKDGDTYAAACTDATYAESFMGKTGSYTVKTTVDATGATFDLKKDYDAALAAAKDDTKPLGAAYKAIANKAYDGESGNIVDIMNAALKENNAATGKQLAELYRAYIDVAYKNGANAAYTKRADLFNGYSAAWDADDLVAMLRIVKTNSENLGLKAKQSVGLFPRDATNDRTPDIIRLCAQLYGQRGADSRYEYTYIDKDGNLKDMRSNVSFYDALDRFGALATEGLIANYVSGSISSGNLKGTWDSKTNKAGGTGFMMYDYSQTQTTQMFAMEGQTTDYMFGAVSTPVSKWDDDGNGTIDADDYFRFTESWRSTKTSGITVSANVKNDANKLSAVLAFVDFLYSNDGQILSTYGPQSTTGNTNPNGFWYGTEVTNVDIATVTDTIGGQKVVKDEYKSQYFAFNNKLYTGTLYKGQMTPTITDELYDAFTDADSAANKAFSATGNFTNFARKAMGATLPMGVKSQSLENQMTAKKAAEAAAKVSVSIANGTIKHPELVLTTNLWYTNCPTSMPLNDTQSAVINATNQQSLLYMTGTKKGDSKEFHSIFHHIIFNGYSGRYNQQGVVVNF